MSDTSGLQVCIDEMNRNLKLQYEGVDSLKATARSILSAASLITGLMSVLQLSRPPIQAAYIDLYNLGIVVASALFIALIITSIRSIMAITLQAPVVADWQALSAGLAEKTGPDLARQHLSNLLNAIARNQPIIDRQTRLVWAACILLPLVVAALFMLSLVPRA